MTVDISTPRPEAFARILVEQYDFLDFVRNWNSGASYSSFISCFSEFFEAVQIDKRIRDEVADKIGSVRFPQLVEGALHTLLEPAIRTSFQSGLRRFLADWATSVIMDDNLRSKAPVPFRHVEAWIDWCITHAEHPILCTPPGNELVSTELETQLVTEALRDQVTVAVGQGWLTGDANC